MKDEKFNYVIGKPWEKGKVSLCCYAFDEQVFYVTIEDAREQRNFIRYRARDKSYKIYRIHLTPTE